MKKNTCSPALTVLATLALGGVAMAQPANDDCANAIPVANHSVTPFDTTGTTRDAVLACDANANLRDMWYTYTASGVEQVSATLCGSSTRTKVISAYWGGCGGPSLACNRFSFCGTGQPRIVFETPGAGTVLICVSNRGTSGSELGVLTVDAVPAGPPPGDTCQNPQILSGPGSYPFDASFAATDGPSASCNSFGQPDSHDLYFSYTADADGYITADTLLGFPSLSLDTTLQIFNGCGGPVLTCNDNANSGTSRSQTCPVHVTAGSTYIIRVAVIGTVTANGAAGVLTLTYSTTSAYPAYAVPENAIPEPGDPCDEWADDVNFGCNPRVNPPEDRFTPISLCQTYKGHSRFRTLPGPDGPPIHDRDCYRFTLPFADTITITGQTQFNGFLSVSNGDYCGGSYASYGTSSTNANCGAGQIAFTLQLPAGYYQFGINTDGDSRATCGDASEYWFRITGSTPCPAPCPADIGIQGGSPGHDGVLDNNDFVVFIDFFFAGDSRADFGIQGGVPGHDGLFDNNDFVVFIDAFFAGCP